MLLYHQHLLASVMGEPNEIGGINFGATLIESIGLGHLIKARQDVRYICMYSITWNF